tara:strand:- start:17514 stop:18338 length:825 start_codon:yes stop_codon:yes gene_type:complete
MKKNRGIVVVGKPHMDKTTRALSFVSADPIMMYANEYDIEDNYSIPQERGIVILEGHYKPKTDAIKRTLLEYRGQVVITSDNQKDVPKAIFNLCDLKRATTPLRVEVASPNADEPVQYEQDTFSLVRQYLKNTKRDDVRLMLRMNKPPDTQLLSWLVMNMHPNKLAFIDANVKRRWSSDYFYDLLAYVHNGRLANRMQMPRRGNYSQIKRICRKIGLQEDSCHLLQDLLKDDTFKEDVKKKLNNAECRFLQIGEKKRRKKTTPIVAQPSLGRWF